jgi:hypothetical protein
VCERELEIEIETEREREGEGEGDRALTNNLSEKGASEKVD